MAGTKQKLSEKISDELQDLIISRYHQGEKIPTEDQLAKHFAVSRITIRAAVANLKSKGILEVRQGDGTYVGAPSPSSLIQPILPILKLKSADVVDIFEVRILIEVKAARSAADKGLPPKDLSQLNSILEQMNDAAMDKDIYRYNSLDLEFHKKIVQFSGNEVLSTIHELLIDLVEETIQQSCNIMEHLVESIIYHNHILKAISIHDGNEAAKAMEHHLEGGLNFIKEQRKSNEAAETIV